MPTYKYLNDTGLERALSKLKTYIDSQSGGGSDVKGAIIFDTTTLSVGNIVRARSITNSFHIYEQTVLESGPQIVMRVEPFEQWKICLVEYGVPTVKIETKSTTALSVSVTVQGTNKSKHTVNSTDTAYSVSCVSIVWNDERSAWVMIATADCVFNSNSYSNGDEIDVWGEDDVVELTVVGELQESVEIGGVYKTVDYGQTLFVDVLDKTSLSGVQGILNAHQGSDLLAIGDEVNVTIGGIVEPYVLLRVTTTEAYFGWRYVSNDGYAMTPIKYSERSAVNNYCDGIYADMSAQDKAFIKDKTINYMSAGSTYQTTRKIWIPTTNEVYGNGGGLEDSPQFPYFTTQANRCKTTKGGLAYDWQLASSSSGATYYVKYDGTEATAATISRVLPCFMLTADS